MSTGDTLASASAYLEEHRVLHRVDEEQASVTATLFLNQGAYRLVLVADHPEDVQLILPFLLTVPAERRSVVAQVAAHVNSAIRLGSFCLDLRDGELRLDLPLPIDGALPPALLERGLGAIAWTLDTYMPALQRACWSDE